jgi:hypothetical protein
VPIDRLFLVNETSAFFSTQRLVRLIFLTISPGRAKRLFGFSQIPLYANCVSRRNFLPTQDRLGIVIAARAEITTTMLPHDIKPTILRQYAINITLLRRGVELAASATELNVSGLQIKSSTRRKATNLSRRTASFTGEK